MILCPEPVLAIASVPVPSVAATSINPPIEEVLYPEPRRPSFSSAQLDDDSVECVAFISPSPQVSRAPNQEEIVDEVDSLLYRERGSYTEHGDTLFGYPTGLDRPRERSQHFLHCLTSLRHSEHHRFPHPTHVRLHSCRDDGSGKPFSSCIHFTLVF